ncbi:MAG: hypothetical protein JW821_04135 [Deltaproteobacteria bacterium]|nr:hypothetical protein [Deltaproteobacteria bacterium]
MGRFCINCKTLFGCIRGGIRYVCRDCDDREACDLRLAGSCSHVTGGICDHCWREWQAMKRAANA